MEITDPMDLLKELILMEPLPTVLTLMEPLPMELTLMEPLPTVLTLTVALIMLEVM
jgi:hypothetical protein